MINSSNILDYDIYDGDINFLVNTLITSINDQKLKTLVCINPHSFVVALKDKSFLKSLKSSDIIIPDGQGIVLASKVLGGNISKRLSGPDIFKALLDEANIKGGLSCFFLGSSEETLNKISHKFKIEYPNIHLCGTFSPPFKDEFSDQDNELMISAINEAKPNILWVGLTAPKQEKWISHNKKRLNVNFIGAVGAVFDYYASNRTNINPLLKILGFSNENFLSRFWSNPRKFWPRLFVSNPIFLFYIFKEKIKSHLVNK